MNRSRSTSALLRSGATLGVLVLTFVGACRQDEVTPIPNRILDRPMDIKIGCYRVVAGEVEALPLSACNAEATPDCGAVNSLGEGEPQSLAFIANSERNELALARRCDQTAGVVDLDPSVPGYNLLPVGRLPTRMAATAHTCDVMTVNAGSCDLSLIEARRLAAYGLAGASITGPSSSLVATVVPTGASGRPLASRASDIVAVPPHLSAVGMTPENPLPGAATGCAEGEPGSVILSFPSCQMIAEIDLTTQRILQSRRFVARADGGFSIEDGGDDPQCPTDCPAQLQGFELPSVEPDPEGFRPSALTLLQASEHVPAFVDYDALLVGGLGGDEVFEIPIDAAGRWASAEDTNVVALEAAEGVSAIRATPVVYMGDGQTPHQFLYMVAGDGSTRVVDRSADPARLGVECDTQIDPSIDGSRDACTPVMPLANARDIRRPSAVGPGIRAPGGAAITDWTFFPFPGTSEADPQLPNAGGAPFDTVDPQVVGVGVTSFGQVIYASLDQYQEAALHNPIDPQGVMNLSMAPHGLWPRIDPTVVDVERSTLPRLRDREPARAQPGEEFSTQALAPALRRIDAAYAAGPETSRDQRGVAAALGQPNNLDRLGGVPDPMYESHVAKVVARDYETWTDGDWALAWEGDIPGTASATGRVLCASPVHQVEGDAGGGSWEGALCQPGSNDPADPASGPVLIDEGAGFCDRGVLAGDKVTLLGCRNDNECGIGQRCLQEPRAPTSATGICISESAYDEDYERLRVLCAPFINDPCGQTRREYRVTRAFQNELYLQALDVTPRSVLRRSPVDAQSLEEVEGLFSCLPQTAVPAATCYEDADCGTSQICAADGICRACAEGEPACLICETDAECTEDFGAGSQCLDGTCARPCTAGDPSCTRAPLPGPLCFPELVNYVVRAHESFVVERNGGGFYTDRVITRRALANLSGESVDDLVADECVEDPSVSPYLTSRIRLGVDAQATFEDSSNPHRIPPCTEHDAVSLDDPNPCQVMVSRNDDAPTLYHAFDYYPANREPRQIPAIRFSNPAVTLTLDLVSLLDLARPPQAFPQLAWPLSATEYRRARIPENYRESFSTFEGYDPIAVSVAIGDTPLVFPVRIVAGEENYSAYIVDAGGLGGTTGVRGQIMRIEADGYVDGAITDQGYRVR